MCFLFLSICRSGLATEFSSFGRERERVSVLLGELELTSALVAATSRPAVESIGGQQIVARPFFFFFSKTRWRGKERRQREVLWIDNSINSCTSRADEGIGLLSPPLKTTKLPPIDRSGTSALKCRRRATNSSALPSLTEKQHDLLPPPRNKEKKRRRRERERPYLTLELAAFSLVRRPVGSLTVHLSAPPSLERSAFSIVLPPTDSRGISRAAADLIAIRAQYHRRARKKKKKIEISIVKYVSVLL